MRKAILIAAAGAAVILAAPAAAQQPGGSMPDSYRQVQVRALELQRRTLLAMVDSMPERLLRDRATPEQRDFAQQIEHCAGALSFIVSRMLNVPGPGMPDTAQLRNSRAGLRAYVNAQYDWAANVLRTHADRDREINLFGTRMPAWQMWDELHQHTFWTAGQVVANFRKHGMAPPAFGFF